MNISGEISTTLESNSSHYFNEAKFDFEISSIMYIVCFLMSLLPNSYVIWLIVTGTGNGLASEFFILNLSVCEILLCLETLLIFLGDTFQICITGLGFLDGMLVTGHPSFECLICVERYLAVVHPVIFLKFKPLRYRLMSSAVAWMAAFTSGGFNTIIWMFSLRLYFVVCLAPLIVFLPVQLFCCVAVLRVLKQSGPGERGREREEENTMKRRAFHLILTSTVTTVIIYVTYFILLFLPTAGHELTIKICFVHFCFISIGLVQPLLFLYRVGKLNLFCCLPSSLDCTNKVIKVNNDNNDCTDMF